MTCEKNACSYMIHVILESKSKVRSLIQREGTLIMEVYTNADYATPITYKKSAYGYYMFLGGNLFT